MKHKLIDGQINDVKKRKLDLKTSVEMLKKDEDKLSFVAKWKNKLTLLIKANTFQKTATEKTASISILDKTIMNSQEEKKNMKI